MQSITPLLLFFAVLIWIMRKRRKMPSPSAEPVTPFQRFCTLLALAAALLIILNPEFLALGLLTDASFFDLLIVLLSIRFQFAAVQAWDFLSAIISRLILLIYAGTFCLIALTVEPVLKAFCAMHKALRQRSQTLGLTLGCHFL